MYAVVRRYSGRGASQLFDELEDKLEDVERVLRGVPGLAAYTLLRTDDGGVSVTVCRDKAGADESVRLAADWIRQNVTAASDPPEISEGSTILHLNS